MNAPSATDPKILYEDNHLIALDKPAGLPTQAGDRGGPSLLEWTRTWVKEKYRKPGNVYLGLVHRLDRAVSGVVVLARTSKAASRLSEQIRDRQVEKIYRACVAGVPEKRKDRLVHYLRKEKSLRATVFSRSEPEAREAELTYRVLRELDGHAELEIMLHTGRFHQIRAQLAFIGHPVAGDSLYRARESLAGGRIALHASRLILDHPVSREKLVVEAPLPKGWPFIGRS